MKTINKVLAGHEDLAIGQGTTAQQREGNVVNVRQVELAFIFRTSDEIRALDITKYTRVELHQPGPTLEYWFDPTSSAVDDGYSILTPVSLPTLGRWLLVIDGSDSGSGAAIPLAGTNPGQPVTGPITWQNSLGSEVFRFQTDVFGPDIAGFVATTEGHFVIAPKNDGGALESFNFTPAGLFSIPSASSTSSWTLQAVPYESDLDALLIAPQNGLGAYSAHAMIVQPALGTQFVFETTGYLDAPRQTDPGDPDTALTTKAYVDGLLPPGGGEANTASSPGASGQELTMAKSGIDLQFKKLIAGTDISFVGAGDSLTINSDGGGGGGLPAGSVNNTLRNIVGTNTWEATNALLVDAAGNASVGPGAVAPTADALTINGNAQLRSGGVLNFLDSGNSNFGLIWNDSGRLQVSGPAGGGVNLRGTANGNCVTLETAAHHVLQAQYDGNSWIELEYNGVNKLKTTLAGVQITNELAVIDGANNVMIANLAGCSIGVDTGIFGDLNSLTFTTTVGHISSALQVRVGSAAPTSAEHATRKDYVDGLINGLGTDYVNRTSTQTIGGQKTFNTVSYYPASSGNPFNADEIANVQYVNDFHASDARMKADLQYNPYGLNEILQLVPTQFTWIEGTWSGRQEVGLIAQDVQKVMPQAVRGGGDHDMMMLNPNALISTLVAAVQELTARVEELENA